MNQSHAFTIVARCAVIAAVVVLGFFTVGAGGAIALGAGVSVAIFFADTKTTHRCRRRAPLQPQDRPDA